MEKIMKYHKIRNVPLDVCTVEQKIAYNLAFRAHVSFQEDYNAARKLSGVCRMDVVDKIVKCEMENYKMVCCDGKRNIYNTDAIFCALRAGLDGYLAKPFVAADYDEIGKAFPANYLKTV